MSQNKSLRILHVYSGNLYGGIESFLVCLAKHQYTALELNHEFALCFEGRLSQELRSYKAKVHLLADQGHEVRLSRPWSLWEARQKIKRLLQEEHFDWVVCHSAWSQLIFGSLTKIMNTPLVFYLHDTVTGNHPIEWLAKRVHPDLAICNSHFTSTTLGFIYPRIAREVLYYPVSKKEICFSEDDRRRMRAQFSTPEDAVVIIQVSRMERWKGHLLHLEALAKLKQFKNWHCWIVGGIQRKCEQTYFRELEQMVEQHGLREQIHFLGQRSNVPELLAAADIHCQPNTGPEPFGITFIEGLYSGLPVVTTNIGGAREIITPECGILVPVDATALADALQKLIVDPSERMRLGSMGPLRAKELADPAARINQLASILRTHCVTRIS